MTYDFDELICREGTHCEKYDNRVAIFGTDNVIPLWIADSDFATPEFITKAICDRAKHPVYGYSFRTDSYFDAIINWTQRRHGWKIDREWICFSPGVVAGLAFAMRAVSGEGDGMVIQPPVYPPFARTILNNNRRVVNNPLKLIDNRFEIDFEDLDARLAEAKALILCSPHNPTGRVFSREELPHIGELCVKHNVVIISDEIHCDLVQKPYHHTHIAALDPRFAERTITLIAPSKTFNIAGLSTSAAIIPNAELRQRFEDEMNRIHVDQGNIFGAVALEAAYNHGEEWLDQQMDYVAENRKFVEEYLKEHIPSITTCRSEGTFLMWLDFSRWNMDCETLNRFLIEEAGLGLNEGRLFGEEGCRHMRLNIGAPRATIRRAMEQLLKASNKLTLS